MSKKPNFTYVDLFAGCGGLSLGLEREGGELLLAVERSDMAAETFFHNLVSPIGTKDFWKSYVSKSVDEQVKNRVLVKELSSLLDSKSALGAIADQKPDVVV
ncbi:MAG: DNA cytosine methyltransferase, partial [Micrococcales bacterium]